MDYPISGRDYPMDTSTISHILCSVMEDADPGFLPERRGLREAATSLAGVRRLNMQDIMKVPFWTSYTMFIDRYLYRRAG